MQQAIDTGDAARQPTLRPLSDGLTSSPDVLLGGNFRTGQDWAAANIGEQLFTPGLTAQNNALLADLYAVRGQITPPFDPQIPAYTWHPADAADALALRPMSTRCRSVTVNGAPAAAGEPFAPADTYTIEVTAPDGCTKNVYTVRRVDG